MKWLSDKWRQTEWRFDWPLAWSFRVGRIANTLQLVALCLTCAFVFRYNIPFVDLARHWLFQPPAPATGVFVAAPPASGGVTCSETLASPAEALVQTALNNGPVGHVICVTPGTASWGTNGLTVNAQSANMTLICTTPGACNITGAGTYVYKTNGLRISGFTFTCTASSNVLPNACISWEGSQNFRFDHNVVNNANWSSPLACLWAIGSLDGSTSAQESYGLIDHNTLSACRILIWGEWGDTGGRSRWVEHGNVRGTVYNVFIEDNTYTVPSGTPGPGLQCQDGGRVLCNFTDASHGGSYVARFNTVQNSYFEHHPATGHGARGTKNTEIYHNTVSLQAAFTPNFSRPFNFQGSGTGIVFENHASSNFSVRAISFNYIKRAPVSGEGSDKCNGANVSDENQNAAGYACLDQIGVSHDLALMSTSASVGQGKKPFYSWNNDQPNGEWQWANGGGSDVASIVIRGRDYFEKNPSLTFDGTIAANRSGVGTGPRSLRPSTCSTGVAWWSTDGGTNWNTSNGPAADGGLDECVGNAWVNDSYVPYTYPHPRQTS